MALRSTGSIGALAGVDDDDESADDMLERVSKPNAFGQTVQVKDDADDEATKRGIFCRSKGAEREWRTVDM